MILQEKNQNCNEMSEKEQQQQQHWKNLSEEKRRLFWKTHLEKNQCIIGELNKQNWLKNLERT